ncbi:MAG: sialate O-acetylesterase, partial [Lentisphaeria bacterium]
VPIFITLGQSNADGWGAAWNFDYDELELYKDERFPNRMGKTIKDFYDGVDDIKTVNLKMWYRSVTGSLADQATSYTDINNSWLNLNYKSDLANNKVTMTTRQGIGTGSDDADYVRSMEAPFGYYWSNGANGVAAKGKDLYCIKGAVGGTAIAKWLGGECWVPFRDNIYKPAIKALIDAGKKPVLVGIWWMQGESDRNDSSYDVKLGQLATQIRTELGFPNARLYVGAISGSYWNSGGTAAAYLAQKRFCEDSTNNAVLIDNYTAERKFHGDMTIAGVSPSSPSSIASAYTTAYKVAETWIGSGASQYQKDLGSSTSHAHYSAGALVEIAKDIYTVAADETNWDSFSAVGAWNGLTQIVGNVSAPVFNVSWPTGGTVSYTYSSDHGANWSNDLPTLADSYQVRATTTYADNLTTENIATFTISAPPSAIFVTKDGDGDGSSWANPMS